MTHWIKRLLAAGAAIVALGSVTMAVSSSAYAADDAKPAVTAPAATAAAAAPAAAPANLAVSAAVAPVIPIAVPYALGVVNPEAPANEVDCSGLKPATYFDGSVLYGVYGVIPVMLPDESSVNNWFFAAPKVDVA